MRTLKISTVIQSSRGFPSFEGPPGRRIVILYLGAPLELEIKEKDTRRLNTKDPINFKMTLRHGAMLTLQAGSKRFEVSFISPRLVPFNWLSRQLRMARTGLSMCEWR